MNIKIVHKNLTVFSIIFEEFLDQSAYFKSFRELNGNIIDVSHLNINSFTIVHLAEMLTNQYVHIQNKLTLDDFIDIIKLSDYLDTDIPINTIKKLFENNPIENIFSDIYILKNLSHLFNFNRFLNHLDTRQILIKILKIQNIIDIKEFENIPFQYIMDCESSNFYSTKQTCIYCYNDILERLRKETYGYLDKMNYNNCIISGGFMYGLVDNLADTLSLASDIDIFVYGTYLERYNKITELLEYFERYDPELTKKPGAINIKIKDFKFIIQIIDTPQLSYETIINNFDYSYPQLCYNGKTILCSIYCVFSLLTKISISKIRDRSNIGIRYLKSKNKGLFTILDEKDLSVIDSQHERYCDIQQSKDNSLEATTFESFTEFKIEECIVKEFDYLDLLDDSSNRILSDEMINLEKQYIILELSRDDIYKIIDSEGNDKILIYIKPEIEFNITNSAYLSAFKPENSKININSDTLSVIKSMNKVTKIKFIIKNEIISFIEETTGCSFIYVRYLGCIYDKL